MSTYRLSRGKAPFLFFLFCSTSLFGEASSFTEKINKTFLDSLPFMNQKDFEEARQGFIAALPNEGVIKNEKGEIVWDLRNYAFLEKEKREETVNPSLWRQATLLYNAGLYKVADRIYQVRGADLSNMTIIEGDEGIIVIDPLISVETAKAALDLYYENRPKKPVKAMIYSHSHIDHFGGVKGVISQEEVDSGKVRVIAPKGFVEAALDENVMAGNVMTRRATYMYGNLIKPGMEGQMTSGLGLTSSSGATSLIIPTESIGETGQEKTIDGVKFVFLFAPDSEAPSEMIFFLPDFKALGIAEDASHTMHNLYTLRGAKVRDAKAWSSYLKQVIELFGANTEVVFGQHHWPMWGQERIIDYLEKQRDLYKYMHDQTLRLANQGYTMLEIAEKIELPSSLSQEWYNRGYYGSLNHNAKAVYNFYLGWFDGNPSHLHPLPPVEAGKKYVEYMGGEASILEKAEKDFNLGNYRWSAEVLNHVVFANPQNQKAKDLLAKNLEQLGYQSENGTWRNFYLTGAKELREGVKPQLAPDKISEDVISAMPMGLFFDYLSIKINGMKAAENPLQLNFNLKDTNENYLLEVKNGVLNYFTGKNAKDAGVTLTLNRSDLNSLVIGTVKFGDLLKEKKVTLEGDSKVLHQFLSLLDPFNFWFNIVTPN